MIMMSQIIGCELNEHNLLEAGGFNLIVMTIIVEMPGRRWEVFCQLT